MNAKELLEAATSGQQMQIWRITNDAWVDCSDTEACIAIADNFPGVKVRIKPLNV